MEKLVSVIVPVYNVKDYLANCIESIIKQTYGHIEILLVNDGSTDGSAEICDQYEKKDERIRVIHKQNGGVSSARNVGIDSCKGAYVCFIDSDDQIHPEYIEKLLTMCEEYQRPLAICGFRADADWKEDKEKAEVRIQDSHDVLEQFYGPEHVFIMVVWNKMYRRDLIADIRYPEGKINEDEYITFQYIYNAKKIARTNEQLYCYTKRENSIMQQAFSLKRLDGLGAYIVRREFYREKGEVQLEIREEYCHLSALLDYYSKVKLFLPDEKAVLSDLRKQYRKYYDTYDRKRWSIKRRMLYSLGLMNPGIFVKLKRI